jgi:hypothetical protein
MPELVLVQSVLEELGVTQAKVAVLWCNNIHACDLTVSNLVREHVSEAAPVQFFSPRPVGYLH